MLARSQSDCSTEQQRARVDRAGRIPGSSEISTRTSLGCDSGLCVLKSTGRHLDQQRRDMTACMTVPYGPWVEHWLSRERFATYLRMAGHDRQRALALYEWSTGLNAALLHDFAHLEVGLRNMYDGALMGAVAPGDNHWLDSTSVARLFPKSVSGNTQTHRDIAAARVNAGGSGAPTGKVIAELTFGFWVFLTARRHEPLVWLPHLAHAYPNGTRRAQLHSGLSDLVQAVIG